VLVRLVCAGASTFALDEVDTGKLISRGGCNPGAVIGVQFKARAADAHLRLTLPTSATWRVAAWRLWTTAFAVSRRRRRLRMPRVKPG